MVIFIISTRPIIFSVIISIFIEIIINSIIIIIASNDTDINKTCYSLVHDGQFTIFVMSNELAIGLSAPDFLH